MSAQADFADDIARRVFERFEQAAVSPAPVQPRLLTIAQAASYVGRSKGAVQHLIAAGKLPTVRADDRVFLDVRDLDEWIEKNKQYPI